MIVLPLQCNDLDYVKATVTTKVTAKTLSAADSVDPVLELPAIELEERIKHELEDNPALEEGKEPVDDLNELKARRGEKRSLLLILRPTFLWEII